MKCSVKKCVSNDDGYCLDTSYVSIDEHGECEQMVIVAVSEDGE